VKKFNYKVMKIEKKEGEEQKPGGRAAALEAYKAANPDLQEEPDDDLLHDFHRSRYSKLEDRHNELEGKYGELSGVNTRLYELVAKDPRLGAVLSMITEENPKSFPYAVAKVYGKAPFDLEGDALEEYESGNKDYLKHVEEIKEQKKQQEKNIETYVSTLSQYAKNKNLAEDQTSEIHKGIVQLAEDMLMGIISTDIIDLVYKGMNYEKDVQEAADTGFVEGKNDVVDAKLKKPTISSIPDLGNATGAGKSAPKAPRGGLGFPGEDW
jgi:hypothetical protein